MPEAPPAQMSDELLVRRAREGDGTACEELFHRHRAEAFRVAYRLLGNEQDALDVVQEAMLKAFVAIGEFDGRCGFRTWLLRIVTNAALDWGRKRRRRPFLTLWGKKAGSHDQEESILHEPASEDDPGQRLNQQELRRVLDQALSHLSPTLRATFVLFAELEMSYKEIAEVQEIPIGTVMSRIHSAREKLQAALDWDRLKEW